MTPDATPAPPAPSPARWHWLLGLATLLMLGPGVVGGWVWDDNILIVGNQSVRAPGSWLRFFTTDFWDVSSGVREGARYYRPLISTLYAVQFKLFGDSPLEWHLVSLAVHLACVGLALRWLRARLGDTTGAAWGALLGAAAFALHPSRPETVSWISGSTDLWAALFTLLALNVWVTRRDARAAILATLALLAGFLCKEAVVAVPLVMVIDAWLLPREGDRTGERRFSLGVFGVIASAFVLRMVLLRPPASGLSEGALGGVTRVLSSLGHFVRLVAVPWPTTAFPATQSFEANGRVHYAAWSVALGALTLAVVAYTAWRARRDPRWRPWLADALVFLVLLAPVLNVVPLRLLTLVSPRFLYLPLLGIAALLARTVATALERERPSRTLALGVPLVLAGAWGVTSLDHAGHFLSNEVLWVYETELDPDNPHALDALALVRSRQGRAEDAFRLTLRAYEAAGKLRLRAMQVESALHVASRLADLTPDAEQERLIRIRTFFDGFTENARGPAVLDLGSQATLSLDLHPNERGPAGGYAYTIPRAILYARTLSFTEAEAQLRAALARDPRSSLAWSNLVLVYASQERYVDGVQVCDRAAQADPTNLIVMRLCGLVREAAVTALPSDPVRAAVTRSERLTLLGAREPARRMLDAALASNPDHADLLIARARVDVADRVPRRALALLGAAMERHPSPTLQQEYLRILAESR